MAIAEIAVMPQLDRNNPVLSGLARIRYDILIINVCILCLAVIINKEGISITDYRHLPWSPADEQGPFVPVVLAFLARRRWLSYIFLIGYLRPSLRHGYEIWLIRTETFIDHPVNVYGGGGILFVVCVVLGVPAAVVEIILSIATAARARREGNS